MAGYNIVCIIAFYPSVNFTRSRAERRQSNTRQDLNMGEFFTDLFDASYLPPPPSQSSTAGAPTPRDMSDPLLSPGAADESLLRDAICDDVLFYTAEWDELQAEARDFADLLRDGAGKRVRYRMMEGQVHAWDRTPNPFSENKLRGLVYREACAVLSEILTTGKGVHELERDGRRIDDLHIVDKVNEITDDLTRETELHRLIGAETPERLGTPQLEALARNKSISDI